MSDGAAGRQCAFCGVSGMSKEHTVPVWIGEVLHDMADRQGQWTTTYKFGTPSENDARQHPAESNRPTVVVKRVCTVCNSGWMSDLEGVALPLLKPMMRGESAALSLQDQLLAATWAVKTAMALEYMRSDRFAVSDESRRFLAHHRCPPDSFRVRLAMVEDIAEQLLRFATFVGSNDPVTSLPDVLCSTLIAGHLVIQVWGGDGAGSVDLPRTGTRDADSVMVWPPVNGNAIWPPVRRLSSERVEEFTREPLAGSDTSGFLDGWGFLDAAASS